MYLITLLIIFLIFPSFVSSKCSSEWKTRIDSDGNTYGYIALISDLINIFQANAICREKEGDIVSIHSEEENNFVGALASPLIKQCQETNACVQRVNHNNNGTTLLDKLYRSLWIGTARVQFAPPFGNTSVQCVNTDGTPCDYGRVDGLAAHNRNITPWGFGNPSGLSDFSEIRSIEGCTELYIGSNSPQPYWNDISCYALLGGVVCKKNCSQTCKDEDMETTTTTKTLTTTTQVNNICNNTVCGVDGWKWHCNEKKTQCMSYHKYTMPSNGTYWDAGAICRKHGSYLASIKSKQENDFVQENYCGCNNTPHWVGIYRVQKSDGKIACIDEEGDQCYTTDNKNPTNNPWAENCPAKNVKDMHDGIYGTKNCVVMKNGHWNDVACARPHGEVLCKKTCISPDF